MTSVSSVEDPALHQHLQPSSKKKTPLSSSLGKLETRQKLLLLFPSYTAILPMYPLHRCVFECVFARVKLQSSVWLIERGRSVPLFSLSASQVSLAASRRRLFSMAGLKSPMQKFTSLPPSPPSPPYLSLSKSPPAWLRGPVACRTLCQDFCEEKAEKV